VTSVNYLYITTIWNNMIGHEITLKKYSIILSFNSILPRVTKIKIIVYNIMYIILYIGMWKIIFSACRKSKWNY